MDSSTADHLAGILYDCLLEAADRIVLTSAFPTQIDQALEDFGFVMGPYERQDLLGLHKAYEVRRRAKDDGDATQLNLISDRMVQEGRLGKISGVGWYRYPGGGGKVDDPLVEDLISEECHFAKITRNETTDAEIVDALVETFARKVGSLAKEHAIAVDDLYAICVEKLGYPRNRLDRLSMD